MTDPAQPLAGALAAHDRFAGHFWSFTEDRRAVRFPRCHSAVAISHLAGPSAGREESGVCLDRTSGWRVEDCRLGGAHNFAADRAAAHQLLRQLPHAAADLGACRLFVARAIRYVAVLKIRQFVVLGPPLPLPGGVHQVALAAAPDARVVYVASDPVAVAFNRLATADLCPAVTSVGAGSFADALPAAAGAGAIDAEQPVCLVVAGLDPVLTERLQQSIAAIAADLAAGSVLVVAYPSDGAASARARLAIGQHKPFPTPTSAQHLLSGLNLLPPGLVPPDAWQPGESRPQPQIARWLAGLAVKQPQRTSTHNPFPLTPCQEGLRDG
ncbi:SAM-dependent methyltransferase [Micromonospora sp. NPDC006766]|uniref:SAM-dependent methyltransferase n=1 Tax=Micromonospora sp. NPDC006766 TaxID=3154778 RepID=UPI0033D14830